MTGSGRSRSPITTTPSCSACIWATDTGRYQYLSYGFANYSADILDLVESTCRAQGLSPRRYARAIRLNRREDVARLVEHVGLES